MSSLKKLCLFIVAILFFFFFTPVSFATPGQLIYVMDTPSVQIQPTPSCDEAIAPYKDISEKNISLYTSCQLQTTQLKKTNTALINELSQEKKIVLAAELLSGIIMVCSVGIIIFIKKKSLSRPMAQNPQENTYASPS